MTDVVYRTHYNQKEAYVYILAEHFSSPKAMNLLQIMRYALSVAENHMKKYKTSTAPIVIPLIIANGKGPWNLPLNWLDVFGEERDLIDRLYNQAFPLVDLRQIEDKELSRHASAGLMEWCLKHVHERQLLKYEELLADLFHQSGVLEDEERLLQTVEYIMYNMDSKQGFILTLVKHFPEDAQEKVMTIAERFKNEGFEKGMQLGIDKGMQLGIDKGMELGIDKGTTSILMAANLLNQGYTLEEVSKETGIALAHLQTLCSIVKH